MIRVVVVDDIASTRENLKKLLSFEEDIEVVGTASDGRAGIDVTRQLSPHVVLMDVNMPGMDGIAATETLAVEAPSSPVVIMSVQGERDYLRRAMQSGAREFLIKPFTGDELVANIRRVYDMEEKKGAYLPRVPPAQTEVGDQPPGGVPDLPGHEWQGRRPVRPSSLSTWPRLCGWKPVAESAWSTSIFSSATSESCSTSTTPRPSPNWWTVKAPWTGSSSTGYSPMVPRVSGCFWDPSVLSLGT